MAYKKYTEKTEMVSLRVPKSKVKQVRKLVYTFLKTYLKKVA